MNQARIVILNYNGEKILPQCLPSVVEAARIAKTSTRITILDNLSQDQSETYVCTNFPEVEFWKAPQNRVLCSYNEYARQASEPILIFLNNDIRVDSDFIDPLVEKFKEDPATFLVAPRVMSFDGKAIEAVDTRAGIKWGMFWASARYPGYEAHAMIPSKTFASGFGAFSRKAFLALGGYDERYLPGIFEDVDICYRAQKQGHRLYYEPTSIVYHMGQASFKSAYGAKEIDILASRNNFLFLWKNFHGGYFGITHLIFVPLRFLAQWMRGKNALWKGWLLAWRFSKNAT